MAEQNYRGAVRARVKRPFGWRSSGTWTALKGGLIPVKFVISRRALEFDLGTVGDLLATGYTFDPKTTTMVVVRIGWLGTSIFARECILLSGPSPRGPLQAAVRPVGDQSPLDQRHGLREIWDALLSVGVRATSPFPP